MSHFDIRVYNKSRYEWQTLIDSYIFSERDRQILSDRLLNSMTYEELGEEYILSDRQVKRIVKTNLEQLLKYI